MPIKYNLTKNDILAGKFHQIAQKKDDASSGQDDLIRAAATLIAAFSSTHSWQTFKCLSERDMEKLRSSYDIKTEYSSAKANRWKMVGTRDIEEVARMNINQTLFSVWLSFNTERNSHETYKAAWSMLNREFQKECDMKMESVI